MGMETPSPQYEERSVGPNRPSGGTTTRTHHELQGQGRAQGVPEGE